MRDTFMNGASVGRDRDAAYGGGTTMAKAELLRKLDAAIAEKESTEASVLSGLAGGEAE